MVNAGLVQRTATKKNLVYFKGKIRPSFSSNLPQPPNILMEHHFLYLLNATQQG